MKVKEYEMFDGRKAVFEYDENGVGKITLECMDMLMGQLIAYKRCIQSRSFWDGKHCNGCMFYDDCPFNPREDEDEPQIHGLFREDELSDDDVKELKKQIGQIIEYADHKTEPHIVGKHADVIIIDESQTERKGE